MTAAGLVEACWEALPPGGRLVANAVTMESEAVLAAWYGELGGELIRLAVAQGGPGRRVHRLAAADAGDDLDGRQAVSDAGRSA